MSEEVELGEVVCEDAVAAPDPGAVVVAEPGASPAEIAFQMGDASFAAGAPFHCGDEYVGSFDSDACCGWFSGAGNRDGDDSGCSKVGFHGGVPVAAICGEHAGRGATMLDDAGDGGEEQVGVVRVAHVDGVIHDETVDVVADLGFVAELDGFSETAFRDWSGVGLVE